MVDAVVTVLAEKLSRVVEKEAKLFSDVNDKVTSLQTQLKSMKEFLNKSQGKRNEHDMVPEVVNQIRDIAYEAESIIDIYVADRIKQSKKPIFVKFGAVDHLLMLRKVSVEIDKINAAIRETFENEAKFSMQGGRRDRGETEKTEKIRRQRREVEEDKVAGFESYSKVVIEQLLMKGSPRNVVSIVGMGGLGKTTLARRIYKNDRIEKAFPFRAWGYVSNVYRAREFFLSILSSLPNSKYSDLLKRRVSKEELKMKVRECLKGNKYLVVVDDVWEKENWKELEEAFPDDKNGSRILITTRSSNVVNQTDTLKSPPYFLPFLNKTKSWELLFKKLSRGEKLPSELTNLGKFIAESCDGLPLAITTMAEILANNMALKEWTGMKENVINWYLGRDSRDNTLRAVLKLSYDNLTVSLKHCFLYLGMFPKGYKIPVKQLIRLWISEGLVAKESNSPGPEFIAERYLNELVNRSLVQVVDRTSDGGVKTCRIHNALRHLCISESKHDKFFEVCEKIDFDSQTNNNVGVRRLSFQGTLFNFSTSNTVPDFPFSSTRSLLCFDQKVSEVSLDHLKWLFKSFKRGHVLDLGRVNVNSLPSELKDLIHLKYLRISSKKLETIPPFICKLWNLETLDLRGSPIKSFSGKLWRLKQLRHLLMLGPVVLPNMPLSESETMPNLQTLSSVSLDPITATLFQNGTFPELKKLTLHYQKHDDTCNPSEQLQSLSHLKHLEKLKLIGTAEIPQNAADVFPSRISKITITNFDSFNSSAMNTLGKLPELQVLKLKSQKSNASFDLHCANGGFPQLRVFVMVGIKVKRWKLNKGSMPLVGSVVMRNCKLLHELPKELWSLKTLRQVNVSWPTKELAEKLQNLEIKNGCKLVVYPRNQVKN